MSKALRGVQIVAAVLWLWAGAQHTYAAVRLQTYDPPAGTRGWCTVVGAGTEECLGSPGAACYRQYEVYGPPFGAPGPFKGYYNTQYWNVKECDWGWYASPAPSTVSFRCDYSFVAVAGRCVQQDLQECSDECSTNNGSVPNPQTPAPINLFSGSKTFEAQDYANASGTLGVTRKYNSLAYSGGTGRMMRVPVAAANWQFDFSLELQLTDIGSGWVTVLLPDGVRMQFNKTSSGELVHVNDLNYPMPRNEYALSFNGVWPPSLSTIPDASTSWTFTTPDGTWILETQADPDTGRYFIAGPSRFEERQGRDWTFTYGSASELTTIEDQFGNRLGFSWLMSDAVAAHPIAVSEILLPGDYKLRYSYEDLDGGATSADRLTRVEWLDAADVVMDLTDYRYEDDRFPTSITEIRDRDGLGRQFVEYQEDGRATSSAFAQGAFQYQVAYSNTNTTQVRTVTSPLGRVSTYTWNNNPGFYNLTGLANIVDSASPNAPASTETFTTSDMRVTSKTDAEGRVTSYVRDGVGRPTSIKEVAGTPLERETTIAWHSTFDVPTQIVRPGLTVDLAYDGDGRIVTQTHTDTTTYTVPYSTNGRTRTWTYGWTPQGLLSTVDGPLPGTDDTLAFSYDAEGDLQTMTNEIGHTTTVMAKDWRGAPLSLEDENGIETILAYDIRGRVTALTIDPGPNESAYVMAYDAAGNLTRLTLPEGGWLEYTYDAASRLTGVENDAGETQTFTVNAAGQPLAETVRNGSSAIALQQTRAYDELGRVRQLIGGGAQTWSMGYDKVDNLVEVTDARSQVWSTGWDALNRVLTDTDPEAAEIKFAYAQNDALTALEDGRDVTTTRIVDGFGLTIFEDSPDRGERTYWYDQANRLTRMVDADGIESIYVWDDADRLLSETFTGSPADTVNYAYDSVASGNLGVGRLTGVIDPSGTATLIYDAQGRVTADQKTVQGEAYSVTYGYDTNGEITRIVYPSGRVVEVERDGRGQVISVTMQSSVSAPLEAVASDITHAPFGPLLSLTYGNGLELLESLDLNYWQDGLTVSASAAARLDLTYSRNENGALDGVADGLASGRAASFGYTDAGRLQYAVGAWGNNSFSYDAGGNRTEVRSDNDGAVEYTFAIVDPASNRIIEVRDTDWNLLRELTWRYGGDIYQQAFSGGDDQTFLYDARKRLVEFEVNNLTAANYTYDYNGQQVAATTGTQSIHYVYDLDGRLIAEHDGSTGSVLREYVWLDDRPLAFVVAAGAAAGTYFLHTGQIGEPLMLTNASGAVVWSVAIDPWGQATTLAPASVELDVRLVGQWLRGVSGLHQNWMRDYDPTLGRYVQADPMGLGDGTNLYTYVEGDPLNDQDPTGEFGLAGALIGAGLDLGLQLATNGGKIECVNWMQVGISGAVGTILPGAFARRFAVSAGRGGANAWKWANAGRRMRRSWQTGADTDLHHWAIPRRFERYGPAAQRIVNHPLNINPVLRTQHDSIHRAATSPLVAWHLGVPTWAKAGQVALPAGAILDALDPDCRCR